MIKLLLQACLLYCTIPYTIQHRTVPLVPTIFSLPLQTIITAHYRITDSHYNNSTRRSDAAEDGWTDQEAISHASNSWAMDSVWTLQTEEWVTHSVASVQTVVGFFTSPPSNQPGVRHYPSCPPPCVHSLLATTKRTKILLSQNS